MKLDEALDQIAEIRAQVAHGETFRGFRALTVGGSGLLGWAAAGLQAQRIARPLEHVAQYVGLWSGVAALCVCMVGVELAVRWMATESRVKRRLTLLALQQFAPCLLVGAVVTAVIVRHAPQSAGLLPGLWSLLFSLGVFSCCRLLPPAVAWVGLYYMAAGTVVMLMGSGPQALSPWSMAGTFGTGQLLAAGILYYTLERPHEPTAP